MTTRKQLNRKQIAVINDIFSSEFDEQTVLDKHKVSRNTYNKWLADASFSDELCRRIESAQRQSRLIIARYTSLAAAKLVQLTGSEKEETARKACLDIITLPMLSAKRPEQIKQTQNADTRQVEQLTPATCSRLLAVLVEEKEKEK